MTERERVARLIRWVAAFIAWPALSISLVMLVDDPARHTLHIAGLLPLGLVAVVGFLQAPRLAARFVSADE